MPIDFKLPDRLIGITLATAGPEESVAIASTQLAPARDQDAVAGVLEALDGALLSHIPGLPDPSFLRTLLAGC